MKAFMVEKYGDQAGMRAGEAPDPQVGTEDVLVRIDAAGVNPLDLRIRNGDFKAFMPYRLPLVLGNDLAGTVVRVGTSVTRFALGDEVHARPDKDRIGTFAELIAVHQDDLAPKPAALTMARPPPSLWSPSPHGRHWSSGPAYSRARRSSSTRAPAVSAPSPSSWPRRWARTWPPP
ncbi:hypothetical protein GCM10010496_32830 [Streptomyces asoensis]|nr:hypothetical protein GCM10010496_32830 [Streptomyces asoensis]